MLPPFIIEQIRQREQREQEKRSERQPRVELPEPLPRPSPAVHPDDVDRGVTVLDLA